MKYSKVSCVLLILPLLVFACSSTKQVQRKPPFNFGGITLSKEIEIKETESIPKEPATTFTTQDREVIAHIKCENLSGDHTLRWDWYDPGGSLYYSTGDFAFGASQGKYLRETTGWHRLSIQGDRAGDHPGTWQVKVFLDDEPMDSAQFILKAIVDVAKLPETSQKPYPKDWGLVIGIEDYAHLPSVDYARRDALIMKEYFIKILGVPEENIISLMDGDATKARMEGYLKHYIPDNVNEDTTLYVYFAGHGAPDMEKGEPYIVPHDGDTRFITSTGYRLKNFYNDLDNLNVQKVYVFIDSCFSGVAARAAEMLAEGTRPALVHVDDVRLRSDDVIAFSASSAGQTSNSYPETSHGLFTYFLLRALKGEADADDDQWVSVKEIYDYVKTHVTRVSRRMGAEQTPIIMPSPDMLKDIAVSRVLR